MSTPKAINFGRYYILDENGDPKPCTNVLTWAKWFEENTRVLAKDFVNESEISTVFLGLPHGFDIYGIPVLYETMIFGGRYDEHQERYSDKWDALNRHSQIVDNLRNGDEP